MRVFQTNLYTILQGDSVPRSCEAISSAGGKELCPIKLWVSGLYAQELRSRGSLTMVVR